MIDLVCSTLDEAHDEDECASLKKRAFLAILDEEEERLTEDRRLIPALRKEIMEKFG